MPEICETAYWFIVAVQADGFGLVCTAQYLVHSIHTHVVMIFLVLPACLAQMAPGSNNLLIKVQNAMGGEGEFG